MQSFISALTTDTCVFSRGFCHLWPCMECSRAFLCKQQHFSIWYGRNSNIRVYREPREHGPLPPHHSWEHTYKKRRWFVQVDLLNQRWSEPEPWAPMSRGPLCTSKGAGPTLTSDVLWKCLHLMRTFVWLALNL